MACLHFESALLPAGRARDVQVALAGGRGDGVLCGWVFAAGGAAIDCVWAGGTRVVAGGRHSLRQRARGKFKAAVRRLVA
jgi:cytosine/adenosine deaminase-related metal-dependent hydrolase